MAQLRIAFVALPDGVQIALRVAKAQDKTYFECDRSDILLSHLLGRDCLQPGSPVFFVRGVHTPGKGASFELFDRFGRIGQQRPIFLSDEIVQRRLLDMLIWEVPAP